MVQTSFNESNEPNIDPRKAMAEKHNKWIETKDI